MRIGELATLVGVSTRTVRHYHHQGLLPEPERLANGYREYRLRDAVVLARVRRLTELGLSLDEIRDVLADERGRDLREVLAELDADLARQQEAIGARRARLAVLLAQGELDPDSTVSPELAAVLRDLPTEGSAFGQFDRDLLTVFDAGADPADRAWFAELFRGLPEETGGGGARDIYRKLDELAGAEPVDPRVGALADELAAYLPAEIASAMVGSVEDPETGRWLATMTRELSAAQTEVFRALVTRLRERGPC
ncbi:MerR family transcriptional regulator [Actinopolymorpha rutila]|uniref:DNA-binding transcriptional MerR regulator n=1 Tax=Actinopolymorpha rutila TaxID=446787 RepID=A0A852ZF60_9ACTN|nr:MerR family transcriptional regulator [Actinopolymorpha rutila]NYH90342.1 DNA-binding transcriptional MerR regulator [Actinopolymorpha rutila]